MTSVGGPPGAGPPSAASARSVPRWTTRVRVAPSARQAASIPALLARTSRARAKARRVAASPAAWRGAVWKTSAPCSETSSGAADPGAEHRVGGRDGVVGVDEVEGEAAAQHPQGHGERRGRPGAPGPVVARPRRGQEGDVADLEPVEGRAPRLGGQAPRLAERVARRGRARGDGAVQDQDAHVGPRVARRDRLPVGPDAQHRVVGARVELRDDGDLHRCSASVRTSSRRT